MNQHGFFTILGLCLLIVAAIFIKGILEFETNYSRGITSYEVEHHLQNLAESYLIEEKDSIENLPIKHNLGDISYGDYKLKNVTVAIYGRHDTIQIKDTNGNLLQNVEGNIILSVASCDSPFIIGKIYRRAFAYIDDETNTIHFMNDL